MARKNISIGKKIVICLLIATAFASAGALLGMDGLPEGHALTREEFLVAVAKIFFAGESAPPGVNMPFADVDALKAGNEPYIALLYDRHVLGGIADGGRLYIRPDAEVTRQDAAVFFARLLGAAPEEPVGFSDENEIAGYAGGYAAWAVRNGVAGDYPDGSFRPLGSVTAGEFTIFMERILGFQQRNKNAVKTTAGAGSRGYADEIAVAARFTQPYGVFAGADGGLIVLDTYNSLLRVIRNGAVETITGGVLGADDNGFPVGGYLDGGLKSALFRRPASGALGANGDWFIADSANHVVRLIRDGVAYTFCGTSEGYADGADDEAKFNRPMAVALGKDGNLYVADTLNHCIRIIDPLGNARTLAGVPGKEGFADGPANAAMFRAPSGIAVAEDGAVFVADTGNHRIRKIENGRVTTIAGRDDGADGDGDPLGGFRDGLSSGALFNLPMGLSLEKGVLYVADSGNNRIRGINLDAGETVTMAGTGEPGDKDGAALAAMLHQPMGVFCREGILYIADTGNNKIKQMPL